MKCLLALPYKAICIFLVGTAILLGGVLAIGVPANLVTLLQ